MAEGDEEIRPEDLEVEGGAVKSFLEHLEDLRWMLIKSSAALFVACWSAFLAPNNSWPSSMAA
jgi:hypothetical protein